MKFHLLDSKAPPSRPGRFGENRDVRRIRRSKRREGCISGPKRLGFNPKVSSEPPLKEYYDTLYAAMGPQHWWPAKSPFEVTVGAILTQNTSWMNVERALANLRTFRPSSLNSLEKAPLRRLERLSRSSGYYRQKAHKLKAFCAFVRTEYQGSLGKMFATPSVLREKLVSIHGIGPETVDSILYAGNHSVFVADAYTKRMLTRHGWANDKSKYDEIRLMFERQFGADGTRFNEFHALIVNTGRNYCRSREPLCDQCPLGLHRKEGR